MGGESGLPGPHSPHIGGMDLTQKAITTREINKAIRQQMKKNRTIRIKDLNGQDSIAAGINKEVEIIVEGKAGDYQVSNQHTLFGKIPLCPAYVKKTLLPDHFCDGIQGHVGIVPAF